jgi:hypothetical protein
MTRSTPTFSVAPLIFCLAATLPVSAADSPDREIQQKIDAIDGEIARLRQADPKTRPNAKAYADQLAAAFQRVRDEWAGKPDPNATEPELHVVGIYHGAFPEGPRRYGVATVRIEASARPFILALCAYDNVRWKLEIEDGVKLQKIILGGYKDQLLDAPPKGVPIEKYTVQAQSPRAFYAYRRGGDGSESYERAATILKELTSLPITTFVGEYEYKRGPFVLGRSNPDWVRQRVLALLAPLHVEATAPQRAKTRQSVAAVRFQGIYWTGGAAAMQPRGELADFTVAGPIESSIRILPVHVTDLASDPRSGTLYGINGSGLFRLDLKANTATELPVEGDIPELSHACAAAFDSKRNRVVIATLGGTGYLYAYDPDKNQWSLLRDLANIDLHSLAYSAEEDCFYGLAHRFGSERRLSILKYSATGGFSDDVDFDGPISVHPMDVHFTPLQVASVGKHLAILQAPPRERQNDGPTKPMILHIVDPKTGKVAYSGDLQPVPAPQAAVKSEALPELWKSLTEIDAQIAVAPLSAKLVASGDVAVAFLAANLPTLQPIDPAKLRELFAKLDHDQWSDREEATAQLLRFGATIEPQLRAALASAPSEEVRTRIGAVLRQIQTIRETDFENDDPADQMIRDPSVRIRLRAIRILSRIGTPAAVDLLRDIAAIAPGSLDSERAHAALRRI